MVKLSVQINERTDERGGQTARKHNAVADAVGRRRQKKEKEKMLNYIQLRWTNLGCS